MNTAIYLPNASSQKNASLARQLREWLGELLSSLRVEARPTAPTSSTGALDKHRTLWVNQPMARDISCIQGTLWLTFDGVRKDVVLEAGQSYHCDCASRLAIHALDAARFKMT